MKSVSSKMINAYKMYTYENGFRQAGDFPNMRIDNPDDALSYMNNMYAPYIKMSSTQKGKKGAFGFIKDGSAIYLRKPYNCGSDGFMCVYAFICTSHKACKEINENAEFQSLTNGKDVFGLNGDGLVSASTIVNFTRAQKIDNCKNRKNICSCLSLIYEAGWKIPDDYPIKI